MQKTHCNEQQLIPVLFQHSFKLQKPFEWNKFPESSGRDFTRKIFSQKTKIKTCLCAFQMVSAVSIEKGLKCVHEKGNAAIICRRQCIQKFLVNFLIQCFRLLKISSSFKHFWIVLALKSTLWWNCCNKEKITQEILSIKTPAPSGRTIPEAQRSIIRTK